MTRSLVLKVTCGSDDPERCNQGFMVAATASLAGAEVSLWLNAMYPGLKAPWFGLQLRQGNSLVGCRRSTWRSSR